MADEIKYDAFRDEWMVDITSGKPSTLELGGRFATKLITQWLDISPDTDNIIYCDGKGDGGIDLAYFQHDDIDNNGNEGHTWYLVQSKYGSALQGADTIVREGRKIFETLAGRRSNLSSLSVDLLERLQNFRKQTSDKDHLVLVFATDNPLNESEMQALNDIRVLGQKELGAIFDARSISIRSIYDKTLEQWQPQPQLLSISVRADIKDTGSNLLVGTVSLIDLYDFLKAYQKITGDLDQIYEKNVRRFLGGRGRVNKAIRATLDEKPELFGLYNNGITIVVHNFTVSDSQIELAKPFIVNGCQTTRTIWDVMRRKLDSGGTGKDADIEKWKKNAGKGMVVTKIVKVGETGEDRLKDIARYTNSQNAVRDKDLLALTGDLFRNWQRQMAENHDVYLEIQRGGMDSQKAFQKQRPGSKQFKQIAMANAFDLLKVYAAGWEGEAGTAFNKNSPFAPDGSIYEKIIKENEYDEPFNVDDLYAAYRLEKAADVYRFGRTAEKQTRKQTRFLFYMVVIDILKDVMVRAGRPHRKKDVTKALHKLFSEENKDARFALTDAAIEVVDSYLTQGLDETVFMEPAYREKLNNDLNAFLKWDKLGKSDEYTPRLRMQLAMIKNLLGRKSIGSPISARDLITKVIT